jgi:NADH-quinone oxidoreductase subunit N
MADIILFLPEIVCLVMALVLFFAPVCAWRYSTAWGIAIVAGIAAVSACLWTWPMEGEPFFAGIYRIDFFSQLVKTALALGYLLVVAISRDPRTLRPATWHEFPLFLLLSTVGMMMMVSATELLTLYISMELSAYPLYIVVALHRNRSIGAESSTKYMIQGMVASAISLYGMSFLFGLLGSTYFAALDTQLGALALQPMFWLAVLLVLSGFLFKLAVFPFHFWAADTYQAAPHEAVTFIATVSKVAAVAILCRIAALVLPASESLVHARPVLMWLAIVAMTLGNFAALRQRDLKRLLGYSAVAHGGYILVGIQTLTELGLTAALFYGLGYAAMSLVCFLVVCEVGRDQDTVPIESVSGLYQRSPLLAAALLVGLLGLIGLPPTVGFIGKWFLFSAALQQGQFGLVLFAAVNAAIALYYYLLVIRQAYMVEPVSAQHAEPIRLRLNAVLAAAVATGLVIAMGTFPGFFWNCASRAAAALVG